MFLVPASLANFAVLYFMTRVLSPAQFGVFYVANTLGNVLFSGSLILNMFFARHLVAIALETGEGAAFNAVRLIGRNVMIWGGIIGIGLLTAMLILSNRFGVQPLAVIPLIVLDAYTSYIADTGRAFFQSVRRTAALGVYTLMWMIFRLIFCLIGVFVFQSAFGALLGIVGSTIAAYVAFRVWGYVKESWRNTPAYLPKLTALLPSIFGYGMLIAISNLDVLVTYLVISAASVGAYSASSIFPKAMLVVTLPLVQILFPGMMGTVSSDTKSRTFMLKSVIAMIVMTGGGAFCIWLFSGLVCGGKWGVQFCDTRLLSPLLFSVVPLSLLRVLVLFQFARKRDWLPTWLIVPTVVYCYVAATLHWEPQQLARGFSWFSAGCLLFFLVVHLLAGKPVSQLRRVSAEE
jgi:O-antigen/teichoic acid export membrane protein